MILGKIKLLSTYLFFCRNTVSSVGELVRLSGKQKKCLLQLILSSRATETQSENGESQKKKKKSSKRDRGGGSGSRGTALVRHCWDKELARWVCGGIEEGRGC